MPFVTVKNFLLVAVAAGALAACSMPTEPDGAGVAGMTNIGQKLQAQGDDAGAIDFYQRALQRKPNDLTALKNMGAIYEAHGNIEDAERTYAQALRIAPDNQDIQYAEGRCLIRMGRAADARDLYRKMLDDNKRDVKAINGLGVALDYLGQHDEAHNQYRAALSEQPDNLTTLNNFAHSYVLAGNYDAAIALLEPHAKDKAATPALRQNLAEAYGMAGMYVDAERLARVDLKPQDVKRNLAYYHARRAKVAPEPKFVADLGSYPTKEMAEAKVEKIMSVVTDKTTTVTTAPEIQSIGGTPSFVVRATGFKSGTALDQFCATQIKNDVSCKALKK